MAVFVGAEAAPGLLVGLEPSEPEDVAFAYRDHAVVSVTIIEITGGGTTKGNPPRVRLRVGEVLRGEIEPGTLDAIWSSRPDDELCATGADERIAAWAASPAEMPPVGATLFVLVSGKPFEVLPFGRWECSNEIRERLKRGIARAARDDNAQRKERIARSRRLEEQRRRWHDEITTRQVSALARKADLVLLGQMIGSPSLEDERFYSFQGQRLKGIARRNFVGGNYFLQVPVPRQVGDLLDRDFDVLLFCEEHGMKISNDVQYTLLPGGVVPATEEFREAAERTIAGGRNDRQLPFCVLSIYGVQEEAVARLRSSFLAACRDQCSLAAANIFMPEVDPSSAGVRLRKEVPGADLLIDVRFRWIKGGEPFVEITALAKKGDVLEPVGSSSRWPIDESSDETEARALGVLKNAIKAFDGRPRA